MKWQLRFLWMKARPVTTFCLMVAVPFAPVVPWMLSRGPDPVPMPATAAPSELLSITDPIPKGAANDGSVRGPSPPMTAAAVRRAARAWEVKRIDGGEWRLLMTSRFAVRGDARLDDLKAAGAFAERFLDAVHARLKGDLTDLRLSIRIFAHEVDFAQWASCRQVSDTSWFYDRPGAEIALLFDASTDISDFCGRLMRGVVFEYLDRALDFQGPDVISEDLASWMSDYVVFKDRVAPRHDRGDIGEWLRNPDDAARDSGWRSWREGPK